jgi:hypothetical protein
MRKRLALLGVSVALGSTMILTSAYAGMASNEGYDALKQAIKKTHCIDSVTKAFELSVLDNETVILELEGTSKNSREQAAGSSSVHISSGGEEAMVALYRSKEQLVIKNDAKEIYTVIEKADNKQGKFHRERSRHQANPQLAEDLEKVIDALVGDLKNYVTLQSEEDGQQIITLDLQNQQIPTVVRAAGSMLIRAAAQHTPEASDNMSTWHELGQMPVHEELQKLAPKLTKDISIDRIQLVAHIDENGLFTEKSTSITVSGQDDAGQSHTVIVQAEADYSDYNQTIPDVIDLEGKPVRTIELGKHE